MKSISHIFSAIVCSASLFAFDAFGAVATTAGSNLTSYNPNTAYNNQWSTLANARYDGTASAKADFGNCNALVLRCAQPKCANGGCAEMNIAATIVAGCVKSNEKCKQYGDDLIQFMSAELVASSKAKVNASNAEQIAAAQQAAEQAQRAAQQAQQNQQQQMAQMQSNMQQQLMDMQQKMAEQNAESARQIADALAKNQQQNNAAIENMRSAATESARAQLTDINITKEDRADAAKGVDIDLIMREKTITGQVEQALQSAETQLKEVYASMDAAFKYASCDNRGDNCSSPKRIKKWRELASGFLDPYDVVIDKVDEALTIAQTVGVNLSDIYMMLNNSCNSWGEYLCPKGNVIYDDDMVDENGLKKGQKRGPRVCSDGLVSYADLVKICKNEKDTIQMQGGSTDDMLETVYLKCMAREHIKANCQYCTLLQILPDREAVYQGWVNSESSTTENQKVIACASAAISDSKLFSRRAKRKSGAGVIDLEFLDQWINQREPGSLKGGATDTNGKLEISKYCGIDKDNTDLISAKNKKAIDSKKLCTQTLGGESAQTDGGCDYIKPAFALCDTHAFNANLKANPKDSSERTKMKETIANKITVISQQMYKQYEYLRATLQRLKIQIEKSVLNAQLERASGKSENSSSGSLSTYTDKNDHRWLAGANNCNVVDSQAAAFSCLKNNINLIQGSIQKDKVNAKKQLADAVSIAKDWGANTCTAKNGDDCKDRENDKCYNIENAGSANDIQNCANSLRRAVIMAENESKNKNSGGYFYMPAMPQQ